MTQSRTMSAIESCINVGSGYILAMATQAVVYPIYGIQTSVGQDAGIAVIFTIVSLIRSFFWRRVFSRLLR